MPEHRLGEFSESQVEMMKSNKFYGYNETKKHGNKQTEKLIASLCDKQNYACHYRLLKFYLSQGIKIKKIHAVIKFTQIAFLEPYISGNTDKRAQAKNDFEKSFYKLLNNAVFGKFLEQLRKRADIRLTCDDKIVQKSINNPSYKHATVNVENELVRLDMKVNKVTLDKPLIIGFAILELAKLIMYKFHYEVMKNKYEDRLELCMTDTDSLVYKITTEDVYEDFKHMSDEHFDFSDYPETHSCYSVKNKKN